MYVAINVVLVQQPLLLSATARPHALPARLRQPALESLTMIQA